MPFPARLRPAHPLALAALGLGSHAGCGAPALREPHPTQPLDEARAVELIKESFRSERVPAAPGADLALSAHATLHADVTDRDSRLGVAYLTRLERTRLGAELPARDSERSDELQIVRAASARGQVHVLVLHDSDYVDDEHVGVPRERTSLTSALKLQRDVLDFLACAKTECWR